MANKKITQLVNKTTILSTDLFPIGDATTGQLYKKTVAELQAAIGGAVISVNAKVGTVVLTTDDVLETVSPANQYFTTTRSRASVSATTPLAYNSSTGVFSIPVATTSANGYLSSTDWTTFNGKENVLTFSSPLVRTTNTISIPVATTSVNGYLSSTDWTTFNNKQGALTLTVTGSSGASTLVGTTLNIPTYTLAGLGGITATFLSAGAGITYSSSTGIIASTITQYTDALARAAHSFTAGSGAYNSTTGVITIPTNTSQLTNGAAFITLTSLSGSTGISYNSTTGAISSTITQYTDALARAAVSAGTGISYNSTTGVITNTITQYTDALARGAISLTTTGTSGASTYNSTTGVLNIPNYGSALSGYLPLTGGTLTGALGGTSAFFTATGINYVGTVNGILGARQDTTNYKGITLGYDSSGQIGTIISTSGGTASNMSFYNFNGSAYTQVLTLASNGAATFSSSVTANGNIIATNGTIQTVITYATTGIVGTLSNHDLSLYANNAERMRITASGNLGIGVTPSAWSLGKVVEVGTLGNAFWGLGINSIQLTSNYLYDGSYKYSNSGFANRYDIGSSSGIHAWFNAPSSTAGSTITFTQAMTLTNGGNLLVGTTTDSGYKLDVNGTGRFSGALNISAAGIDLTTADTIYFSHPSYPTTYRNKISTSVSATASYQLMVLSVANGASTYNNILTLNGSGAATFSGSVTAQSGIIQNATGNNSTLTVYRGTSQTYGARITALDVDGSVNFESIGDATGPNIYFKLRTLGTPVTALTLASTGAATFSSSVTANAGIIIGAAGTGGGSANILKFNYETNTSSRSWQIFNDAVSFGDFVIQQSTTQTGTTYTTPFYISNTGNVGIGTTSATNAKLKVSSSSAGGSIMSEDTTSTTSFVRILGDISSQNLINWQSGTAMRFAVSNQDFTSFSEVGRITSGGNWLLGTATDNGERLYVSGAIRATGTITANSDIRLKKNLERIENALEKVGQISGYTYNTIYDDKRHGGVIAQEIDEVFPEIVNKGNDGLLGVEYGNISALLIEALKEATTKIKALESKVEALQNL